MLQGTVMLLLHTAKTILERAAHRQDLGMSAHGEPQLAVLLLLYGTDRAHAHDHAAVYLPEGLRVERRHQFLEWCADMALALGGGHARVLVLRLEEQHLVDGEHL